MANLQGDARQLYVADLFARIAGRYDLMNSLMTGGLHHRWKRRTARVAARGLAGPALDIATGTGDLAFALARQPGINRAVGVDLLPEMLALGRKKHRATFNQAAINRATPNRATPNRATPNRAALKTNLNAGAVGFLLGDALALPFPDNRFACATAGFSLRNMPDLPQAVAEMARVVRPGGRVATLELTPMTGRGVKSRLFRLYFHRLVPLIGQLVAGDRAAYTYLPQSVDYFLQADRLATLFQAAGLVEVGYRKLGLGAVAVHWGVKPGA